MPKQRKSDSEWRKAVAPAAGGAGALTISKDLWKGTVGKKVMKDSFTEGATTGVNDPLSKKLINIAKKKNQVNISSTLPPMQMNAKDRAWLKKIQDWTVAKGGKIPDHAKPIYRAATKGDLKKNLMNFSKGSDPHVIAHEMGHGVKGGLGTKFLRSKVVRMGAVVSNPVALGIAGAAGVMHYNAKTDKEKAKAKRVAVGGAVVGAGLAAPMLAEEVRANYQGAKILRKQKMPWKEILKKSKGLIRAQSSYPILKLIAPLGILAGTLAMRKKKKAEGKK